MQAEEELAEMELLDEELWGWLAGEEDAASELWVQAEEDEAAEAAAEGSKEAK